MNFEILEQVGKFFGGLGNIFRPVRRNQGCYGLGWQVIALALTS